jgi:hypothetical protein
MGGDNITAFMNYGGEKSTILLGSEEKDEKCAQSRLYKPEPSTHTRVILIYGLLYYWQYFLAVFKIQQECNTVR